MDELDLSDSLNRVHKDEPPRNVGKAKKGGGYTDSAIAVIDAPAGKPHAQQTQEMAAKFLGEAPIAVRTPKALEWVFGIPRGLISTKFQQLLRAELELLRDEDGKVELRESPMRRLLEHGFKGQKPFAGEIPLQHRRRMAMVLELCDLATTIMEK